MCTKVNMNSVIPKRLSDITAGDCFLIIEDPESVHMKTATPALDIAPDYTHTVNLTNGDLSSYSNNTIVSGCSVSINVTN